MRLVRATRYVTPLREGGSVPAIVEADDEGTYVTKLRGAAQGPRALVAEIIAGEVARKLGLPMPDQVLIDLDAALARTEPDPEIQDVLRASVGRNVALDYLPGALGWEPALAPPPDGPLASRIVWFDALVSNVDRTAKNPNLLLWHKRLYLIDHGAALYFHHDWASRRDKARSPFAAIRSHVLLARATELAEADEALAPLLDEASLRTIVEMVPDEWLIGDDSAAAMKQGYVEHLCARLIAPRPFVEEAARARALLV